MKLVKLHTDASMPEVATCEMDKKLEKPSMAQPEEQVKIEVTEEKLEDAINKTHAPYSLFGIPEKQKEAMKAVPEEEGSGQELVEGKISYKEVFIEEKKPKEQTTEAREAIEPSNSFEAVVEAESTSESNAVEIVADQKPGKAKSSETGDENHVDEVKDEVEVKIEAPRTEIIEGHVTQKVVENTEVHQVKEDMLEKLEANQEQSVVREVVDETIEIIKARESLEALMTKEKGEDNLEKNEQNTEDKLKKDFGCNVSVQLKDFDIRSNIGLPSENKIENATHEAEVIDPAANGNNKKSEEEMGNLAVSASSKDSKNTENNKETTPSEPIKEREVEVVKPEEKITDDRNETKDTQEQPKEEVVAQAVPKQCINIISKVKHSLIKAKKAIIKKSPSSRSTSNDMK